MKKTFRILCFGDSNTWGRSGSSIERYPADVRWTKLLQAKLGDQFEVIEEGLRSRTTDLNDDDPQFPYRSGKEYLRPCIESQSPVDIVILWLGTNDLKHKFNRTPEQVASALGGLIEIIQQVGYTHQQIAPRVLLISPPVVREEVLKPKSLFTGAGEKSQRLAPLFEKLATATGCEFIDLAQYVQTGDADGVHLDSEMHPIIADLFYQRILQLCQ